MGSLKTRWRRFPVPGEPGEWMAFRRLSERELEARTQEGDAERNIEPGDLLLLGFMGRTKGEQFELALRWLHACLMQWSYDEPCTMEMWREHLDRPTLVWAFMKAMAHSHGEETPEEKKVDLPSSTPGLTASPAPTVPESG